MNPVNDLKGILLHPRHRVFATFLITGLILLISGMVEYGFSCWKIQISDTARDQSHKENSLDGISSFRQFAGKLYQPDEISGPDQGLTPVIHSKLNAAKLNEYLFETGSPETSRSGGISVERMTIRLKNLPAESIGRVFDTIEHQEPLLRIHEAELNAGVDGSIDARLVIERWVVDTFGLPPYRS